MGQRELKTSIELLGDEAPVEVDPRLVVSVSAPTNIAVIKYWGKKSREFNTPINSSASVTLDQDDLRAMTTVCASPRFARDRLWLNGAEEDVAQSRRFQACLREVRRLAQDVVDPATGEVIVSREEWGTTHRVHIASFNTFPTAAGLASSAAGFACLVHALAQLMNARETYEGELTAIARQGSGSACRSLYGGLVQWTMGESDNGADSVAVQIADENHWPELRALILVVSDARKDTSSTTGMVNSVKTSPLLAFRATDVVPARLEELKAAYLAKDFATFAKLTMQDSNQFHATCLDTYPPIFYMNDTSRAVVRLVHAYNDFHGTPVVAYTFDAGPNAVLYTTEEHMAPMLAAVMRCFPPVCPAESFVSSGKLLGAATGALSRDLAAAVDAEGPRVQPGGVRYVYATKAGGGPRRLGAADHLIDLQTGGPMPVPAGAGRLPSDVAIDANADAAGSGSATIPPSTPVGAPSVAPVAGPAKALVETGWLAAARYATVALAAAAMTAFATRRFR